MVVALTQSFSHLDESTPDVNSLGQTSQPLHTRPQLATHHRHRTRCPQCFALDHVGVDVSGQHDGELGPGFAAPDQPDGRVASKPDDGWFGELVFTPEGVWLGVRGPGRAERCWLWFVSLPQTELRVSHVDVALAAELDGETDLGLVQTNEDESGFGDGLGGPMARDEPRQLEQSSVAVAPGLALVQEVFGPELLKPGQVGVGIGA